MLKSQRLKNGEDGMFKKVAIFLLFGFVICGIKNVNASTSSIMLDAESGKVIYAQNADELRYPASLTKLMTLYITFNALEQGKLKLKDKLKVSATAAGRSPSKLGVVAGEKITVEQAVTAVIVKSANDCATVLAEHFAPSEAEFAVLMTKTARKLGMKHTTFKNASGLPNSKQKTTARDMSILAMAVYHHFPQYYKRFSQQSFKYKGQTITGHNHLLSSFKGADGMKTGYTAASGYNIVTSARRDNKRVIAVTMGHKYLKDRDAKAALMMDKGLKALKKSDKVDVASLTRSINGISDLPAPTSLAAKSENRPIKVAEVVRNTAAQKTPLGDYDGFYAVQVGAFSDYNRARNHAAAIKNELSAKYAELDIKVEKTEGRKTPMYRSKVIGLSKTTAQKICQSMQRQNKSCLVVADNKSINLARK